MRAPKWRAEQDDTLRQAIKWGWSDRRIAAAMDYSIKAVRQHRRKLGLAPQGKPGCAHPHTSEVRAVMSERMARQWQDPEYRAKRLHAVAKAHEVRQATRWRVPAGQERWHRKLRRNLGAEAARAALTGGA